MYQNWKKANSLRPLIAVLIVTLMVSFAPLVPVDGVGSQTVWAASPYGAQGFNQTVVLVDSISENSNRTDIDVVQDGIEESSTPFINQINTNYYSSSQIKFVLAIGSGTSGLTSESFTETKIQYVSIYKDEETRGDAVASNSALNTGNLKVGNVGGASTAVEIYVDPGTLEAGDYVLVFDKGLPGNSADRILGVDVEYKFTVVEGSPITPGAVIDLTLSNSKATVTSGQEFNLDADLTVFGGGLASNPGITWEVSPSSQDVITIMSNADKSSVTVSAIGTGTAKITATSDDNSEATALCDVTVNDAGTYAYQTILPFKLSSTPARNIKYVSESLTEINNSFVGRPFDSEEEIKFTVGWGGGTGGGGQSTPTTSFMPYISVVNSQNQKVATIDNGKISQNGWNFSITSGALEANNSYKLVIEKEAGTRDNRHIEKQVVFSFKTLGDPANLSNAKVTVNDQIYTGEELTPDVTVELDDETLVSGTDYTISYRENTDVGTAYVSVAAVSTSKYFTGTKEISFNINPIDLADADINVADQAYTGKEHKPNVNVSINGKSLDLGTDYTVSYRKNTDVGTAYVSVSAVSTNQYYTGSKEVSFKINPKNISGVTTNKISDQVYSGTAKKPAVKVQDGSKMLKEGTDYTITYSTNKNIGKAVVSIKGKGNYAGTKTINFKVNPKKNSVSKITSGKKKMTVKWKKVSSAQKVTKYEVRYRVKGTSKWKTKSFSSKSSSATIKKMKKGKKYQVQVRSYKTVSGIKYYSAWSGTKTSKKIK